MTEAVTIDQAGRIVLPIAVRRRLNLVPGSRLTLDVVAQRIELTPQAQPEPEMTMTTAGQRRVLPPSGAAFDAAAAVRAERDARAAPAK